jgi:hypothetical protein
VARSNICPIVQFAIPSVYCEFVNLTGRILHVDVCTLSDFKLKRQFQVLDNLRKGWCAFFTKILHLLVKFNEGHVRCGFLRQTKLPRVQWRVGPFARISRQVCRLLELETSSAS